MTQVQYEAEKLPVIGKVYTLPDGEGTKTIEVLEINEEAGTVRYKRNGEEKEGHLSIFYGCSLVNG